MPEPKEVDLPQEKAKAYTTEVWFEKQKELQEKKDAFLSDLTSETQGDTPPDYNSVQRHEMFTNWAVQSGKQINQAQKDIREFIRDFEPEDVTNFEFAPSKKELFERVENQRVFSPSSVTTSEQLELVEKSLEIASRYIPSAKEESSSLENFSSQETTNLDKGVKIKIQTPESLDVVSTLLPNSALDGNFNKSAIEVDLPPFKPEFLTPVGLGRKREVKNSIRTRVLYDTSFKNESEIQVVLEEDILINNYLLKKGSVLLAKAKVNRGRLELKIESILVDGHVLAISFTGYDHFGNAGLAINDYSEVSDSKELLANMGNTASNSISFNSSFKDQLLTNLSSDLISGVSGIFSNKLRSTKVFVYKGQEVLFVYQSL